jgi:hypothetical protein
MPRLQGAQLTLRAFEKKRPGQYLKPLTYKPSKIHHSSVTIGQLDQLEDWLKKWRININETKSTQVTFILRTEQCPAVHMNNTVIPQSSTAKYLGLHLDDRLTWKQHIVKKKNR